MDIKKEKLEKFASEIAKGMKPESAKDFIFGPKIQMAAVETDLNRVIRNSEISLSDEQLKVLSKAVEKLMPSIPKVAMAKVKESFDEQEKIKDLSESDPSLRPPQKWFAEMAKEIKTKNTSYSEEQIRATIGDIWYHQLSTQKKKEIRGREGKHFGKPEGATMKESTLKQDPVDAYLQTALWSSTTEDGTPLDQDYDVEDLSPEVIAKAKKDVALFIKKAGSLLDGLDLAQVAHDFWLTRNRHGAGFWDGDYEKEIGEKLTDLSHEFGEVFLYVGDDNRIYEDKEAGIALMEGVDSSKYYQIEKLKKTVAEAITEIKANPEMYKEHGTDTVSYFIDVISSEHQGINQPNSIAEFFGAENLGYKETDEGKWVHDTDGDTKFDSIAEDNYSWEAIEEYADMVAKDLSKKVGASLGFSHIEGDYGLILYVDLEDDLNEEFSRKEFDEANKLLKKFSTKKTPDDAAAEVVGFLPEIYVDDVTFLFGNRELIAYTPEKTFIWDVNDLGQGNRFVLFDIRDINESFTRKKECVVEDVSGEMEVTSVIPLKNTLELKDKESVKYIKLPANKKAQDFKVGQKIKMQNGKIVEASEKQPIKRELKITVPTKDLAHRLGFKNKNAPEYPFDADSFDDTWHSGYSAKDAEHMSMPSGFDDAEKLFPHAVVMAREEAERMQIAADITQARKDAFVEALEKIQVTGEYMSSDGEGISVGGAGVKSAVLSPDSSEVTLVLENPEHLINDVINGVGQIFPPLDASQKASDKEINGLIHNIADYFEVYGDRKPSGELDSRYSPDVKDADFKEALDFQIKENLQIDEIADAVIDAVDAEKFESEKEAAKVAAKLTGESEKDILKKVAEIHKGKAEKHISRAAQASESKEDLRRVTVRFDRALNEGEIEQLMKEFKQAGVSPSDLGYDEKSGEHAINLLASHGEFPADLEKIAKEVEGFVEISGL